MAPITSGDRKMTYWEHRVYEQEKHDEVYDDDDAWTEEDEESYADMKMDEQKDDRGLNER